MAEFKFYCPQCGQHIACDISHAGMPINCPACQQGIVVPEASVAMPNPPRVVPAEPSKRQNDRTGTSPKPNTPMKSNLKKNLEIAVVALTVVACGVAAWFYFQKSTAHPPGLVALWTGEYNANDSIGTHNGTVAGGISYSPGTVGRAFDFDGAAGTVSVPASPSLDVGAGRGFTLACWIAPSSATDQEPLMEWRGNNRGINQGVHFWISVDFAGVGGPGCIYANVVDVDGGVHIFASPTELVKAGMLQYVALAYDKNSGMGKLYYDGSLVASKNLGVFTPKTDTALLLGRRADGGESYYRGKMDEVSLYNRALSVNEIHSLYNAGKAGKH